MSRVSPTGRSPKPGFASYELLIVITIFAVAAAVALPFIHRAYNHALSRFTAQGESLGWLQHLQAAGISLLVGAIGVLVIYLAAVLLFQGTERVGGLWEGFIEAKADFQRHWKD